MKAYSGKKMPKLLASTSLIILGSTLSAMAQDNVAVDETPVQVNNPQVNDIDDSDIDTIVVTGSRIPIDSAITAASPIQTVTIDQFVKSGDIDIARNLRNIPALQGSDPATLQSAQGAAATGLSTLDLRQLGTDRTLVLLDGRRHVPGVAGTATVDINSIPQALIARTEVLTGGASSVYGADAVSGVVNFITRTGDDFDGIEYRFQGGISDEGDTEEFFGSIAGGGTFADDRGSGVFAVEFNHSEDIVNNDRPGIAGPGFQSFETSGAFFNNFFGFPAGTENILVPNPTLPVSSNLGSIALDPDPGAFPFGAVGSFSGGFNPAEDTVPTIPGTNIPVLQVVDPQTGELRAFNPGISAGSFNASGGDSITGGQSSPNLTLIPQITRFAVSSAVDYDITNDFTVFAEGKFSFADTQSVSGVPFSDDLPLALDNAFLPADLLSQIAELQALDPSNSPSIAVARDITGDQVDSGVSAQRSTIRAAGGFKGKIPFTDFDFNASYTWGRTDVDTVSRNQRINDRFFTALDAVALTSATLGDVSGTTNAIRNGEDIQIGVDTAQIGDIVCRSSLTGLPAPSNIASLVGGPPVFDDDTEINGTDVTGFTRPVTFRLDDGQCAPLNILGIDSIGGAGADFAFLDLEDDTVITQQQILISITGDSSEFFELPAGPIGFAAGFEWRKDASQFTPDALRTIEGRVVGNATTVTNPAPTDGQDITVTEGFAEIRVPLLKDLPFIKYLEVNGAGRISDYNTIGSTETFSFGGRYQPHDWLTLRGTFSRAIRAPNIGELFNPQTAATIGVNDDPCDDGNIDNGTANRQINCLEFVPPGFDSAEELTAFVTGTTGGNPDLLEEISESITAGIVFQPTGFIDGLTIIADYYDIDIEDAIGSLTGAAIASACVDLPSTDNQFCDAIQRVPIADGGEISDFTSGNINFAVLEARGVDFEIRYNFDVPTFGNLDLGSIQTSVIGTHFIENFFEGDPIIAETIASVTDPVDQEVLIVDNALNGNQLGVVGIPDLIFNIGVNWAYKDWTIGWTGRFEESTSNFSNSDRTDVMRVGDQVVVTPNVGLADPSQIDTGNGFSQNINVSYDFSDKLGFYAGVNNLTNTEPFAASLSRPVGPRGRFLFLGVQGKF